MSSDHFSERALDDPDSGESRPIGQGFAPDGDVAPQPGGKTDAGRSASPVWEAAQDIVRASWSDLRRLAPEAARAVAAMAGLSVPTPHDGDWTATKARAILQGTPDFEAVGAGQEADGPVQEGVEGGLHDGNDALQADEEALAEALLLEAGRVTSDTEAAALSGGITITITGPAPLAVRRIAPLLTRGTVTIVRALRSAPSTRPLTPVAGAIARSTVDALARRASAGHPVTPQVAAYVMARQTAETLGQPARIACAIARSAVLRRRLQAPVHSRARG
jgi:hypothetical protein